MNAGLALLPNCGLDAATLPLQCAELPAQRTVVGRATVGTAVLSRLGERTVGVWEISPSVSTDIEVDEVFLVLQGEATVSFADGSPDLHLRPGVVARLAAGAMTTWAVTKTLRKIYLA